MNIWTTTGATPETPHVGFATESFLYQSGAIFDGGAARHFLHLLKVATGISATVTVYRRGRQPDRRAVEGLGVVTGRVPVSRAGGALGSTARADCCMHLHLQYLERLPRSLASISIMARTAASTHDDTRRVRYLDACRTAAYYTGVLRRHIAKHGEGLISDRARRPGIPQPRALLCPKGGRTHSADCRRAASYPISLVRRWQPTFAERIPL